MFNKDNFSHSVSPSIYIYLEDWLCVGTPTRTFLDRPGTFKDSYRIPRNR